MVYDDQRGRGGTRLTPGDDELRRITGMSEDEKREAEQRAYDEEFAGIVAADQKRSAMADRVMQDQQQAAKGFGADPLRYDLAGLEQKAGSSGTNNAEATNTQDNLYKQEEAADSGYYNAEAEDKPKKRKGKGGLFAAISTTRRNLAIIAIIGSTIAGVTGFLNTLIQPFQLPTISQFLEDQKYAGFNNASRRAMEQAFTGYVAAILLPGMRANGCPTTKVARNCTGDITGEGPVKLLWRKFTGVDKKQASIEYKMAQLGIEFVNSNGQIFMRVQGEGDIDLSDVENGRVSNIFDMEALTRGQARERAIRAFEDTSEYKSLLYRMRVQGVLKKYGIIRCMVACEFKDRLHGRQIELQRAGLAFLNQRVFETRAQLLGLYLNCLLAPCDDILTSPGQEGDEATNGEPSSELHRSTRNLLAQLSARFGAETLEAMVERVKDLDRDGLQLHLTKLAIQKIGGTITGNRIDEQLVNKIAGGPVALTLMVVRLAILISQFSQLKTMNYLLNAAAAVQVAEMMRTVSHETRAGQMDSAILGSTTNIFRHGPFNSGPGLSESPAWDKTVASINERPAMAFMRTILPQKAYAQAADTSSLTYVCNDGRSIFNHQREAGAAENNVCDEMRLGMDGQFLVELGEFVSEIPLLNVIIDFAEQLFAIIDQIAQVVIDFLRLIPGVAQVIDAIGEWLSPVILGFFRTILKDPLGDKPSGARITEMAIQGFEVGGADSAHRLLGGQVMSPGQQAVIMQEEEEIARRRFEALPLKERLFSTESSYSLAGQIALTAPSDMPGAMRQTFAGLLGNPLGKLANSVGSIFTLNRATAQDVTRQQSMFNVVAHGYPKDHEVWNTRPDIYWDENCADGKINEAYNTAREDIEEEEYVQYGYILDERTNQPINPVANPCFMWYTLGHFDEPPTGGGGGGGPITRNGTQLLRNGQPWKFAGMNADAWGLNNCRSGGPYVEDQNMTDANIDQYFRELNPSSVTRIWPYRGEGNIELMDRIVTAAEKYGQYLAPAFFDGNDGGTQCGSRVHGDVAGDLAHIRPIVERYAKGTGARATDVIAFWETSNEIGCDEAAWHTALAQGIKQMDPNTLVTTGTAPYSPRTAQSVADCHSDPAIDLISIHEYDDGCDVSHQADKAIEASRMINKPWYSGESGGWGDYNGGSGMGECLKQEWQAYIDAENGAGMLYWNFQMQPAGSAAFAGNTAGFLPQANVLWEAAKTFRHQYNGGAAAAPAP